MRGARLRELAIRPGRERLVTRVRHHALELLGELRGRRGSAIDVTLERVHDRRIETERQRPTQHRRGRTDLLVLDRARDGVDRVTVEQALAGE